MTVDFSLAVKAYAEARLDQLRRKPRREAVDVVIEELEMIVVLIDGLHKNEPTTP